MSCLNTVKPNRRQSTAPLVESLMTFGSRLDPFSASYFPNITGFLRGELDFYNISLSNLNETDLSWKSYAQSYMADSNMTEVTNQLGTWNWNATQKMSWSIMDRALIKGKNSSDDIAVVHVGSLNNPAVATLSNTVSREELTLLTAKVGVRQGSSSKVSISLQTGRYTVSLNLRGN